MAIHIAYTSAPHTTVEYQPSWSGLPDSVNHLMLKQSDHLDVTGTRAELLDLAERITDHLDATHDIESSASRQHFIDTGRYLLR